MVAEGGQDRVLLQKFEVQKFLGKGSYGSVFRVKRLSDGKIYALKETNVKHMSQQDRADAVNEIRLLASVRHQHVVSYHEAFVDGNRLCIVMEYAPNGDLAKAIKKRQQQHKYFAEDTIWSYLIQISLGLQALHAQRILHRDVKTANVLRCQGEKVKIGDLGVAKLLKNQMTKTQIGTPHYMPPEVWKNRPYSFSSDTWALGCVGYELCTFTVPFEGRSLEELRYRVLRGRFTPIPNVYSHELSQVIQTMLDPEPTNRPTMDKILAMPQFKSRMHLIDKPASPADSVAPSVLLDTIKVPKNLRLLMKRLPEARYPGAPDTASSWPNETSAHERLPDIVTSKSTSVASGVPTPADLRLPGGQNIKLPNIRNPMATPHRMAPTPSYHAGHAYGQQSHVAGRPHQTPRAAGNPYAQNQNIHPGHNRNAPPSSRKNSKLHPNLPIPPHRRGLAPYR